MSALLIEQHSKRQKLNQARDVFEIRRDKGGAECIFIFVFPFSEITGSNLWYEWYLAPLLQLCQLDHSTLEQYI